MSETVFKLSQESIMNFQEIFNNLPGNFMILQPNHPHYTILWISDELLSISALERDKVVGQSVFDIFPENADTILATRRSGFKGSLQTVIKNKRPDQLPIFRYDVLNTKGVLEERYWRSLSKPVLNKQGEVSYIIHSTVEVTDQVKTKKNRNTLLEIEKTHHLFMQAPVAICIVTGPQYIVELANEDMLRLLGRTPDIVGKPIIQSLTEADTQGLIAILDTVRTTCQSYYASTFPATLLINGIRELKYFDLIFKPYYQNSTDKEPTSIFCAAHNVTEQVAARKKVKESEHRYRTLIEESTVAAALYIGPEIRIQYANDIMLGYWGKDASVIGKTFREALPELEVQPFPYLLENVYATGENYKGSKEKADLMVDGKLRSSYYDFTYKALRNKEGEIYGIHHMAMDVTKEVLAIKILEEEKERTRLAISVGELGVFEIDLKSGEVKADKRFYSIFGVEEPVSRSQLISLIYPDDLHAREKALREAVKTGLFEYEFRVPDKDGKVRWIKSKGNFYRNEEGEPLIAFGVVQDITKQKLFEEELAKQVKERTTELENKNKELERSNANLEEFAHAASHDLKEPIRKIHFFTDHLKDQLTERLTEEERLTFKRIEKASQRMGALIDDLLLYSHVSHRPHEKEEVDLNEKLNKVLEDLELDIQQKKATITPGKLPVVKGYRRQLQQLFQNLIGNALKYCKPGVAPEITITSDIVTGRRIGVQLGDGDLDKKYYRIEVKDNGIGFEQKESERIFQMFQRLHGNTEYRGTGVGLSIAQKVAENHNGKIVAEGEPGKGASFKVYLPMTSSNQ